MRVCRERAFRRGRPGGPRRRRDEAGSRGSAAPLAGGLNDGSDGSSAMAATQAHKRLLGGWCEAAAETFSVCAAVPESGVPFPG